MTHKDLLLASMDMSTTKAASNVIRQIDAFVEKEKKLMSNRYDVVIPEGAYKRPYNFLIEYFGKGGDKKITQEELRSFKALARRKVMYDVLGLARDNLLERQIEAAGSGDLLRV